MFRTLKGKIKSGKKLGRRIGFPTINIAVPKAVKKNWWGIYFSLVKVGKKVYPGITHLGPPKTFNLSRATCESHLLAFKDEILSKTVEKKLLFKFRDIEQFPNIKKLKKQIKKDVKLAKKFFGL